MPRCLALQGASRSALTRMPSIVTALERHERELRAWATESARENFEDRAALVGRRDRPYRGTPARGHGPVRARHRVGTRTWLRSQ